MNKTTQREEFIKQKNIKLKHEKKFISRFMLKKLKNNKNKNNDINKISLTSRDNIKSKNKIYKMFSIPSQTTKNLIKENPELTNDKSDKNIKNKKLNKKNHSIDFKKIISREDVERMKEPKYFKIPFITPNYSLVENKLITTLPYDIPKYNKNTENQPREIHGYDYKLNYSPDKYITKFNNHISPKTPNFSLMFHREGNQSKKSKKINLPFYMKDIHDRQSIERMTETSLKQNKYCEGKISLASSSFLPKKSFNRIININYINSKNFKDKLNDDYIEEKKEYLKQNTQRQNKQNTIEELKNFGLLNRFENFTYKAIDKRKNMPKNKSMENIFKIV